MALIEDRPADITFHMHYIGRKDCSGADAMGIGGDDVEMPSNDLNTHELLDFFEDTFGFDTDETVVIMGVHAVGVAHRNNIGFGNVGKEDGWVFEAESYVLNNRYYSMLVGADGDYVNSAPEWEMELVHNENGVPSRYQWYHEKDGEEERPIMTNADMALVRDLSDHMSVDADGNEGAVNCSFKDSEKTAGEGSTYTRRRVLETSKKVACPVASHTIEKMVELKMDNELFLYEFEKVLKKMVKNGY